VDSREALTLSTHEGADQYASRCSASDFRDPIRASSDLLKPEPRTQVRGCLSTLHARTFKGTTGPGTLARIQTS